MTDDTTASGGAPSAEQWRAVHIVFLPEEFESLCAVLFAEDPRRRPQPSKALLERVARARRRRAGDPTDYTEGGKPIRAKNRLYELRRLRGLTIEEEAKVLGSGFDAAKISKQEHGHRRLSAADIEAYCKLFKVHPHELFVDNIAVLDEGEVDTSEEEEPDLI